MSIPAGRLRHRVQIEQLVTEQDSDGASVETWADAVGCFVPAEIMPLSGRELIAAAAVQAKVSTRIRIRYRAGISPSMRVVHRGILYGVEAVVPDQTSGVRYLTLMCTDGVNQG